ncbi:exocyst complex component EXO70A1-like [Canna indica]|uniref:Exocyst subunit Exo70 family protein n=1 Tax=Canna indica TaxID=4628 RepID=A0AAQ3KUQ2_9LILI|nr:exocyst complex component EXO70A1-like [Canna indica]
MPRKGMRSLFSSGSAHQHRSSQHDGHGPLSPSRHTFSDTLMQDNIDAAEEIISKWRAEVDASLFSGTDRTDARFFLRSVADLHRAMLFFSSPSAASAASPAERSKALLRAHSLLSVAMCRLQRELHLLLSANYNLLNPIEPLHRASSASSDLEDAGDAITETTYPLPESFFDGAALTTPSLSAPSSPSSVSTATSFEGSPSCSSPRFSTAVGSISSRIAWFVLALICKLDSKAELYRDVALSYLFLANNIQYIVRKVKDSGLRLLLGDEWVARHRAKARHYAASYERLGWSKVAATIPAETSEMEAAKAAELIRRFNAVLEAACKGQAGWVVVADGGLNEDVRDAVAEMVVPAYRVFYERYRETLRSSGAASAAAVRFSPEDVANRIHGIFVCSTGHGSSAGFAGSGSSSRDSNRSK